MPDPAARLETAGRSILLVAIAASLSLAALLAVERHDPACASCHLPPEAAFVARAQAETASDLASAHAALSPRVRCIDCHAQPGAFGRLTVLGLAAEDAWSFVRGDYVVVGQEYLPLGGSQHPLGDAPCAACHAATLADDGFENHFHALLDDPEAPPELACVDCHAPHREHPESPWHDDRDLAPGCDVCHALMGGPSSVLGTD